MTHSGNLLLDALTPPDADRVRQHFSTMQLSVGETLTEDGMLAPLVYFPIDAVISLVVSLGNKNVECAMVGWDGAIAVSPALDGRLSLTRAKVQIAGKSFVCEAAPFKKAVLESPTLLSAMIRHEQTVFAQAQQATACMSQHSILQRLSRLLLRARDLSGEDEFNLTQRMLSELLGVRRTSITDASRTLNREDTINYVRGKVSIKDLEALRGTSCGCYKTVNLYYSALLRMRHEP
jgi:hypothetical protein